MGSALFICFKQSFFSMGLSVRGTHTRMLFRQQSNNSYIKFEGAYCRYLCTESDRSICFIDVLALTCRQIFILRGLKTLALLSEHFRIMTV